MRNWVVAICSITSLICLSDHARAQEDQPKSWPPDLLVVRDGWEANPVDVKKVFESTGRELWKHFPDRQLAPIVMYPKGGPIVLYQRGPSGEIVVRLNTGRTYWAQYAFQFSHELCHILSGFDDDPHGNDWFEETLCELASLYSLRQMGESWKTDPPYEHWKDYARHLTQYANDRIDASNLPEGKSLAQWYADNADALRETSTNRDLNNVAAVALLDLFESSPEHWNAISFINVAEPTQTQSLTQFLYDWYKNSPDKHHEFIKSIAARFEIDTTKFDRND